MADTTSVLVVEDEPAIVELVTYSLREAGWEIRTADTAAGAWDSISRGKPDLLLLDWMLPDQSGLRLLSRLRADRDFQELPVIMLTAKSLHERGVTGFAHYDMIRTIGKATSDLLHDSLDAFARLDGKQALQIIAADEIVDHEFRTILRNLITFMMEDPRTISSALDTLWVAKAIERIGDHAKNIAEYVIYVVEGRDIRHSKPAVQEG